MPGKTSPPVKLPSGGFFSEIALRVKLVLRLMADPRVNIFLKLMPMASAIYLFMPDLMIGPFDDAAVVSLLFTLFVELCPQEVVDEHTRILRSQIGSGSGEATGSGRAKPRDDVIEGEFYDIDETSIHNNGRKEETEKR